MEDTGVGLIKIDVDQAADLSSRYNIKCMPTLLLIQGEWDNVVKRN